MKRLAALSFAFLTACGSGGSDESHSAFYDECIKEGYSDQACSCADSFAQAGKNPYRDVETLLRKCKKFGY